MDTIPIQVLKKNLDEITQRIDAACGKSKRRLAEVQVMAVTKTFSADHVQSAIQCGLSLFGENRVQEADEKFTLLMNKPAQTQGKIELHLIGHLQRNKIKKACRLFSCVQSIDKYETAASLNAEAEHNGTTIDILIEINTSGEDSKSGLRNDDEFRQLLDTLLEKCAHLRFRGLMTIGPLIDNTDAHVRRSFSALRELFLKTKTRFPELKADTLSMGMSGDFETAVEEGSTMVRIGTALFGERRYG